MIQFMHELTLVPLQRMKARLQFYLFFYEHIFPPPAFRPHV